jgi:hypothetical protein
MAAELSVIMQSVGKMGAFKVALSAKRLMALTAKITVMSCAFNRRGISGVFMMGLSD